MFTWSQWTIVLDIIMLCMLMVNSLRNWEVVFKTVTLQNRKPACSWNLCNQQASFLLRKESNETLSTRSAALERKRLSNIMIRSAGRQQSQRKYIGRLGKHTVTVLSLSCLTLFDSPGFYTTATRHTYAVTTLMMTILKTGPPYDNNLLFNYLLH